MFQSLSVPIHLKTLWPIPKIQFESLQAIKILKGPKEFIDCLFGYLAFGIPRFDSPSIKVDIQLGQTSQISWHDAYIIDNNLEDPIVDSLPATKFQLQPIKNFRSYQANLL